MQKVSQDTIKKMIVLLTAMLEDSGAITLKEYIETRYIPDLKIFIKKGSNVKKTLSRINVILSHKISSIQLHEITKNDVKIFLATLEKDRGISKATSNRYRTRLMAIFNHAIENKLMDENPVQSIKKNKEIPRSRYLDSEEIKRLMLACETSRNKELSTIVSIALNTGLREGEILNLKYSNLVDNSIQLFATQTKTGLPRTIPLNSIMRAILKRYFEHKKIDRSSDHIFRSKSVRSAFEYALRRANIRGFRFHDLRRTFATMLKDKNANTHTISKLLGHTNLLTTERYLGSNDLKLLDTVELLG